jgi:hypothetical protein
MPRLTAGHAEPRTELTSTIRLQFAVVAPVHIPIRVILERYRLHAANAPNAVYAAKAMEQHELESNPLLPATNFKGT